MTFPAIGAWYRRRRGEDRRAFEVYMVHRRDRRVDLRCGGERVTVPVLDLRLHWRQDSGQVTLDDGPTGGGLER